MNKKIQEQLDQQIESKRAAAVVSDSELPFLDSDIFDDDTRETEIVEIRLSDMTARIVESSDAPKLTRDVLQTLGTPIKTVEFFYRDRFYKALVRDGVSLALEIEQLKVLMQLDEGNPVTQKQKNVEISRLYASRLLVDPAFSYHEKEKGAGVQIESVSEALLNALSSALKAVDDLYENTIFRVAVYRGTPEDRFALFSDFEWYSVGKSKKYTDMGEDELNAAMARNQNNRQIEVAAMIADPPLCIDPEATEPPKDENAPYPVGLLSERFMRTLHQAHLCVTTPENSLRALQRHFRSLTDTGGADATGEPVRAVRKAGDKTVG